MDPLYRFCNIFAAVLTKLLIVRFSSLGDIVLTTPVVRCAKKQWHGEVEIHYLTKKQFGFLVEHNPHVDRVHTIERSTNEIIEELREIGFDYILDLHHNARSFFLKKKLKALPFEFNKLNFEKWLLVNFGINRMPKTHIVDRYMETLAPFKIENDGAGLDYFLPEEDVVDLSLLPPEFQLGYIAFVIGGTYRGKKLPPQKIAAVCSALQHPVVLLGGSEDVEAAEVIMQLQTGTVWNAAGQFNFNQSASLIERSIGVIAHDTGLMHVASAFKKPIISVWGGTVPEFGMSPYLPGKGSHIVEPRHLKRRPCSKLGNRCKYKACRCVEEVSEDEIIVHATQIVSSVR